MHTSRPRIAPTSLWLSLALLLVLPAVSMPPGQGVEFVVDSALDEIDITPGDGNCAAPSGCTLRAAVIEANALAGADTIWLPAMTPAPSLTLAGAGEDASLTGDLDILDDLTITGDGMAVSGAEASSLSDRALHVHSGVTLNLSGVSFFWADAGAADGGGLLNEGTVSMTETSFQFNRAANGAGLVNAGDLTLERSLIGYNTAAQVAAGILNTGSLTIDQSTITHNEVLSGPAGGILNHGTLTILNSTIDQNRSTTGAAAVQNGAGGSIAINNTTIYLNAVPAGGGGDPGSGGLFNESTGSIEVSNSILAVNAYGPAYAEADCMGTIVSAGYNIFGSLADCDLNGDTTGNLDGVDPLLPALPTVDPIQTWGYPPLAGSPAIDAGSPAPVGSSPACEVDDQRGYARPIGFRCDIGAYESEFGAVGTPSWTPTASDTPTDTPTATATSSKTFTPVVTSSDTPTGTQPTPTRSPTVTRSVTPPPPFLFADGFETGDLSAWSSAQTDHGDLRVSARAAIEGNYGLEAVIDDNRALYVVDESPDRETTYRARFAFDPNGISIAGGKNHIIFLARRQFGLVAFRIELRSHAGDIQVRAVAPQAGGPAYTTPWITLADEPHSLEVGWSSATESRDRNGRIDFLVDGQLAARESNLRNHGRQVDSIRLGAVAGADGRTRGTYFFDSFASTTGFPIGP